jgi:hypothetical protein
MSASSIARSISLAGRNVAGRTRVDVGETSTVLNLSSSWAWTTMA